MTQKISNNYRPQVSIGLVRGVESVASFAPGGGSIAAAVRGGGYRSATTPVGAFDSSSVENPGNPAVQTAFNSDGEMSPEQLIELQRQVNREQLTYSTVSNVLNPENDDPITTSRPPQKFQPHREPSSPN